MLYVLSSLRINIPGLSNFVSLAIFCRLGNITLVINIIQNRVQLNITICFNTVKFTFSNKNIIPHFGKYRLITFRFHYRENFTDLLLTIQNYLKLTIRKFY